MAKREERGSTDGFSRGAELWMYQARLFVMTVQAAMLISISAGPAVATTYSWSATTVDKKHVLERNVLVHTRDVLHMTAGEMELDVNGELRKIKVPGVALLTGDMAENAW